MRHSFDLYLQEHEAFRHTKTLGGRVDHTLMAAATAEGFSRQSTTLAKPHTSHELHKTSKPAVPSTTKVGSALQAALRTKEDKRQGEGNDKMQRRNKVSSMQRAVQSVSLYLCDPYM